MLALGLASAVPLFSQPAPGEIVSGVQNRILSRTPAGPPCCVVRGGPAIAFESKRGPDGAVWTLVIGADGSVGWIKGLKAAGLRATALPRNGAPILNVVPADPASLDSAKQIQPAYPTGEISGSAEAMTTNSFQLALPPHLNPFGGRWLQLAFGPVKGWTSVYDVSLSWDRSAAPLSGLVRKPFLPKPAGAREWLRPGEAVPQIDGSADSYRTPEGPFEIEELIAGAPSAPAVPELALVSNSGSWLMVVKGARGQTGVVPLAQYRHVLGKFERADLNGDGAPELLVRDTFVHGDGYTSVLWVIDCSGPATGWRAIRLAMEADAEDSSDSRRDSAWWVDRGAAGSVLWIARSDQNGVAFRAAKYANGGLSDLAGAAYYAAVTGSFDSHAAAQSHALAHPAELVFPSPSVSGGKTWSTGRLFANRMPAQRWAAPRRATVSRVRRSVTPKDP